MRLRAIRVMSNEIRDFGTNMGIWIDIGHLPEGRECQSKENEVQRSGEGELEEDEMMFGLYTLNILTIIF